MKIKDKISEEEKALFRTHMKGTKPLSVTPTAPKPQPAAKPLRKKIAITEPPELERFTDTITTAMTTSQDSLHFCRSGITQHFFRQLQKGKLLPEDSINLRHMTTAQARRALWDFLQHHAQLSSRCLLVIHGKGHRSATEQPILKNYVNHWLRQYPGVLAFSTAPPRHGGTGAVFVLLRAKKGKENL